MRMLMTKKEWEAAKRMTREHTKIIRKIERDGGRFAGKAWDAQEKAIKHTLRIDG